MLKSMINPPDRFESERKILLLIFLIFTFSNVIAKVEIPISRIDIPPKIDGIINDEAWKNRYPLPELVTYNPIEGQKPKEHTEVYITYDDDNFYLAFICYDSDISQLRATIAPREGYEGDDLITFAFDPYNSDREGYIFNINPYGNPIDFISSISGYMDRNWNIIFHIGTKIYDDRWTVEVALPFKSLTFDDTKDEQEWGFYCFRIDKKNDEFSIYPPRTHKISNIFAQAGVLKGLRGIKSGKNMEFLPYIFNSYLESEGSKYNFDTGINVSYGISSKLTLSATLNPDYSQIESDPENININQRNPQWLDEKRSFFSRGMDFFNTSLMNIVYTRNIVNPILCMKLSGKYPDYSLSMVSSLDKGIDDNKNYLYNLFRIKKNVLKESAIGLIVTNKDDLDSYNNNRVFATDAILSLPHNFKFKLQSAYSLTGYKTELSDSTYKKVEKYGWANQFKFERDSEFCYNEIWINSFPQDFYLESGFLNNDARGKSEVGMNNVFKIRQVANIWNEIEWYFGMKERFNMSRQLVEEYGWTGFEFSWKGNMWNKIGLNANHDRMNGKDFRTAELEFRSWKMISGQFDFWLNCYTGSKPYYGDDELNMQNSFTGWHCYFETGFNAKIFDRININPNIERDDFYYSYGGNRKYYSYKIWNRITWMIANKLHLRNITQGRYVKLNFRDKYALEQVIDKNFSTSFLFSYEYSPLSNIYLGFNLNNITHYHNIFDDIQVFFKINYLWRL